MLAKKSKTFQEIMIVQSMLSIYYGRIRLKKKITMKHKTTKIQGFLLRRFLDSKTPGNAHAHLGIIVITSFHTSGSRTPIGGERQNPGFNSPVEDGNLSHDFTLGVFCSTNPRWWLLLFLNAGFLNTNDSTVVKKRNHPQKWYLIILHIV